MKILFIAYNFQPEPNFFVGLPFAKALQEKGHQVQVLTGFPNYPSGKIYDGYKVKFIQKEIMDGVPVIRVPLYASHDRFSIRRMLSYISSSLSQSAIGPWVVDKADVAYVSQGPATIGWPAVIHKWFRRIPFVYSIQDLWPDSLLSTEMFSSKLGLKVVNWWCKKVYNAAAKIVVIAPGMKQRLIERGVPEDKIEVIYNWCDDALICREEPNEALKKELGLDGKFNIIFAGNMGKAQAMEAVIKAADILQKDCKDVQFVLIGSGVEVDKLKQMTNDLSLNNVKFLSPKPITEIGSFLRLADVLLVHLKNDPLFEITVPSKTQAYLATGKPVLIGVKGDAAKLIEEANAGLSCEPGNFRDIAEKVKAFYSMDREKLNQMGTNAANYYDSKLSFEVARAKYEKIFQEVAK